MMSINKIWRQLKSGENLDLYFTLFCAIALVILNIIGLVPEKYLTPIILTVLTVILAGLLGIRLRLERISTQIEIPDSYNVNLDFPKSLETDLKKATELWFCGIHLDLTVELYYSLFEEKAKKGTKIHFLLVEPKDHICQMLSLRYEGKISADDEKARIIRSLNRLSEFKKKYPNSIVIKTIDYLLPQTVYLLEPNSENACAYVAKHTFQLGRIKPKLIFRKEYGDWYNLTFQELMKIWDCANEYTKEK